MASKSVAELKALAQKQSLQGKRALAAETYQLLFKEEPSNPRWPQKAGEEFRTVGQKDKAVAAFQAAAKLYSIQGFTLKAITLCKLILDLDKSNQAAQQLLASISTTAQPSAPLPTPAPPRPAAATASPPPSVAPGLPPEMIEMQLMPEPAEFIDMIDIQDGARHEVPPVPAAQPRQPQMIEIPVEPEKPELPEAPEELEMLETPEALVAPPAIEMPEVLVAPEAPPAIDVPELPETPGEFEVPAAPEAPPVIDMPEFPETPGEFEVPAAPEAPPAIDVPELPETPGEFEVPAAPEVPEMPEAPAATEAPAVFEVPQEPETPGVLEAPEPPAAPAAAELFEVPAAPGGAAAAEEDRPLSSEPTLPLQPADTLVGSELSRVMPPSVSSSKFDVSAFDIVLDEPEAPASSADAQPAPPPVSPKDEILTRMPPIPIFSSLGRSALQALVERVEVRTFAPGARLITEGDVGNSLFVLVDGEVAVMREGPPRVELTRLGEGSFFGEIALVTRVPRTATVEAVRECQALEISREVFNELVQSYPDTAKVLLRHLRERLVQGLVKTHPLFAPFAGSERTLLVRRFSLFEAPRDFVLAEEGAHASHLYVMLCGKAESTRGGARMAGLTSGDIVGVESLLTGQPSLVSVKTQTKCWILKMPEETFREVILTYSPVLATLSDMIADQTRKSNAAAGGGALEQLGIPLY